MPWVRIEEKALTHPKILRLSDGAFRFWVAGLAHCQQHLTDGAIPSAMMRTLVAMTGRRVKELVDAGLWLEIDGGYQVHDYLQHNESRAVVLAKREAAKNRMRSKRTSPDCSREQTSELRPKFACGVVSSEESTKPQRREEGPGETIPHRAGSFAEWYGETHERLVGVGYIGNPRADYENAQRLVQKFTDAELRDAAIVWFGMTDDFATRGTRTIAKFASRASDCVLRARRVSA
jgi:hypothetical protein